MTPVDRYRHGRGERDRTPLRRSDFRRHQIRGDLPWLLCVSNLAFFALLFQVYPRLTTESVIAEAFNGHPGAVRLWGLLMLLGCVLVFVGVYRLDARWDVAGCLALAAWALSYDYVILAVRGLPAGLVACSLFSAFFLLCMSRAWTLANEPEGKTWHSRN